MNKPEYKTTIGLEVHARITSTECKLFSAGANNDIEVPNSQLDLLDLGAPGAIQVLNKEAVSYAVRACIALNMRINQHFCFDRKHYFYPDLPNGYQITQFFKPIGVKGYLPIYVPNKRNVNIRQLHLEIDAGKSIHQGENTFLDFNRAGSPLMEIVTEPDLYSAEEAVFFVKMLQATLRQVNVCDGNMELGNFRVDVSISVSNTNNLGTRVEVKNLNSYRSIKRAIEEETHRQIELITNGEEVEQETRLFNDREGKTFRMRTKEDPRGYMYFKDPDLPHFVLEEGLISTENKNIIFTPESLFEDWKRFVPNPNNLISFIDDPKVVGFMMNALEDANDQEKAQMFKLMSNEIFAKMNKSGDLLITAQHFCDLVRAISEFNLSSLLIKEILEDMWESGDSPNKIISRKKIQQTNHTEVENIIKQVLIDNPKEVERYNNGEVKLFSFFIGQTMKQLGNRCDPKVVRETMETALANTNPVKS